MDEIIEEITKCPVCKAGDTQVERGFIDGYAVKMPYAWMVRIF
jgi:hypothetical protein